MEDKRVGKSNRSKAICITVIVLLCIGLTGLFLMEYRSGNTNRKQKGSKNHTAEQTEQPIDWDSLQKVKLNHHKYGLLHKVTSWLIIGTDVSGNQDGIGEDYQGAMADFMLLVVFDEENHSYGMLQLNRDTMTEIHLLDNKGEGEATADIQLCTAHWYGGNRQQGCENTITAVSHLLGGVPIDGYYELPMKAIPVLNKQVGGVTVTLEDDFSSVDAAMVKGKTITLSDSQAFHYIHDRYGVGDEENTSRMRRQRQYMSAFADKAKQKIAEDNQFAATLLNALDSYAISEINQNDLMHYLDTINEYQSQGMLTIDGKLKLGKALGDGLEHREFYADAASIEQIVKKLYPLMEQPKTNKKEKRCLLPVIQDLRVHGFVRF